MEWNEYKTNIEDKNRTNEYSFLKSNFAWVSRLLVLIYLSRENDVKYLQVEDFIHQKELSRSR